MRAANRLSYYSVLLCCSTIWYAAGAAGDTLTLKDLTPPPRICNLGDIYSVHNKFQLDWNQVDMPEVQAEEGKDNKWRFVLKARILNEAMPRVLIDHVIGEDPLTGDFAKYLEIVVDYSDSKQWLNYAGQKVDVSGLPTLYEFYILNRAMTGTAASARSGASLMCKSEEP